MTRPSAPHRCHRFLSTLSDNHIRALLDPASPDHFHPVFAEVVAELEGSGGLKDFRQLGDHVLIALDGTEYHVSNKVHCQQCSTRKRGKDKTEHFHALVSATIVAPEHNRVVPLEPEFIVPQDGHDKQDCESRAVRRWLERHGQRYARLKPVYLGPDNNPVNDRVTNSLTALEQGKLSPEAAWANAVEEAKRVAR